MFHSFLFIFTGGFLAVKELPVIAAKVNHNLLQYDIRILRGKLQVMGNMTVLSTTLRATVG